MTNYFTVGLFIWLFIYFLKENNDTESIARSIAKRNVSEPEPKKHIQYISNGRVLSDTLFYYYYDMLSLTEKKQVNNETIVEHAIERYALINKIDYDYQWPISTRDVNAAKAYVLERYYYMTNLN